MSRTITDLIKVLKTKDPKAKVEFIVVTVDGMMVTMDVANKATNMVALLKMFK